jgi:hypothetical protein
VFARPLTLLKKPMTALAERYLAAWHTLGPIAAGEEFFRIDYTDFDDPVDIHEYLDRDEFAEPRIEWLYIASLKTLLGPPNATSRARISSRTQVPEGFELVIKRIEYFDGSDDDGDEDTGAEILFRKDYPLR